LLARALIALPEARLALGLRRPPVARTVESPVGARPALALLGALLQRRALAEALAAILPIRPVLTFLALLTLLAFLAFLAFWALLTRRALDIRLRLLAGGHGRTLLPILLPVILPIILPLALTILPVGAVGTVLPLLLAVAALLVGRTVLLRTILIAALRLLALIAALRGIGLRLALLRRLLILRALGRRGEAIGHVVVVDLVVVGALQAHRRRLLGRLRRCDQAEIMLRVLEITLRHHRIARGMRVARELEIFFRDVMRGAADFDVRAVGFIGARERVGALAAVAAAHPLVLSRAHDHP
jgi:hypothetical protein